MSKQKTRTYKKFTKEQRSSFSYWLWHWLAFNDVARKNKVWRFHHLFHDIEKPFLKLVLPYKKVQEIHRKNNSHHLEYKHPEKRNWADMVIDWECSGYTKIACPRNAIEEANFKLDEGSMTPDEYTNFLIAWTDIFIKNKKK